MPLTVWNSAELEFCGPLDPAQAATAVLDAQGVVVGWSHTAEQLFGYPPDEVLGSPAADLLAVTREDAQALLRPSEGRPGHSEDVAVRHRDGHRVEVSVTSRLLPSTGSEGSVSVLLLAEASMLRNWVTRQAVLRALFDQSPVGLTIYDTSLRVAWINATCVREMAGPPEDYLGLRPDELVPGGEIVSPAGETDLYALVQRVLATGTPAIDLHYRGRPQEDPAHDRFWSYSYYRLTGARGEPLGVCEESYDITDRYRAEQRLQLLVRAGERIGTTLDLRRTVQELADVAVPQLAERVTVDLRREVLQGPEAGGPPPRGRSRWRVGAPVTPLEQPDEEPDEEPAGEPYHRPGGARPGSRTLAVPLRAGESPLGVVTFRRGAEADPYTPDETVLADELVRRAAVSVDNARRYADEHGAALMLQRNLLPGRLPPLSAVDVASRYLPADSRVGVGGDWFDVIPLSGSRVGLVVGDVVGHGLSAAATMGRLRTTVRALAQLELGPDELLTRLDDLVAQTTGEQDSAGTDGRGDETEMPGGTCLYGVYDPVARSCVLARAGHLLPAAVTPEGRVSFPDLPSGPPLGTGGLPFESAEIGLPEGSLLALFTDGLVEARGLDVDEGLHRLASALARPHDPLEDLCDRALSALPSARAADDAALLLVRTRAFGEDRVAAWQMGEDPADVSELRGKAVRQLETWGLDALSFTTELVVSELLTNALRHATGPVRLRLIRDVGLICEVSDTGHTSPRARRAGGEDEGGRGLFLVSSVARRWGTRYTPEGKVIWAEQSFSPEEDA